VIYDIKGKIVVCDITDMSEDDLEKLERAYDEIIKEKGKKLFKIFENGIKIINVREED